MRSYELTDHLGNVHLVLSDLKKQDNATLKSEVLAAYEYYPGGMSLQKLEGNYRFGHGGQEKIEELQSSHYTAQYWEYDSRLIRRWNVDPVIKFHESPYAAFANNPMLFIDPSGADTSTIKNYMGHSADVVFSSMSGSAKQGDKHTVYAGYSLNRYGRGYFSEVKTKVYHEGNDYAEAGWYTEDQYEYVNRDWANGQVLPPLSWWEKLPAYTEGAREWNGWGVDSKGYLTGTAPAPDLSILIGGVGGKASKAGVILKAFGGGKKSGLYTIYYGYKEIHGTMFLYIGKAKNGITSRYSVAKLTEYNIRAFKLLDKIPENGTALGVEQAIMELNGWAGKVANKTVPVLSNVNNATVKEIYKNAGLKWLNKNIPDWQSLFKVTE